MTFGCLTAGHRILTADLRYVPVETLQSGDRLFAFTEQPHTFTRRRYWREGIVLSNVPAKTDVYRLYLSDGTTLETTWDHPFLLGQCCGHSEQRWATVEKLYQTGYHSNNKNTRAQGIAGKPNKYMPLNFRRALPVWEAGQSNGIGYLAGFADGEGSLSQRRKTRRGDVEESHFTVQLYQNDGPVLKRVEKLLGENGFCFRTYRYDPSNKDCRALRILGGTSEVLRFLGIVRPTRLLDKLNIDILGAIRLDPHQIISY